MASWPQFPEFKPIELGDRGFLQEVLWHYQPQASEWTFTNLFIWRSHYHFQWSVYEKWLVVVCRSERSGHFALQPLGPSSRLEAARMLLRWLREEKGEEEPRIVRADGRMVSEIEGAKDLLVEPTRDYFDYVYRTEDLINLAGRRYHSKKNHINRFRRSRSSTYAEMEDGNLEACLEVAERWCQLRRCEEDLNLLGEWEAIREALTHFRALGVRGGVVLVDNEAQAFTHGELLNEHVAVVHIEKADPEIPGLFAVVNQQFCENLWGNVPYINREEDLGEPGLRRAKESYHPHHLVEKFEIKLSRA
mgnify:CR=1 FL=1